MSEFIGNKVTEQYTALMNLIGGNIINESEIESIVIDKVNDVITLKIKGLNYTIEANKKQIRVLNNRLNTLFELPAGATTNDARLEDIKVGYDGTVHNTPGEAVRHLGSLIDTLNEQTITHKGQIDTTHNLNDIIDPGVYYIYGGRPPVNIPDNVSGSLMVFRSLNVGNPQGIVQVFYSASSTWTRYTGSQGFTSWRLLVDVDYMKNNTMLKYPDLTSDNDVDNILEMGTYYVYSQNTPLGLPEKTSGLFMVFNNTANNRPMGTVQMFVAYDQTYVRYRTSEVFSPWQKLVGTRKGGQLESTDNVNELFENGVYYVYGGKAPSGLPTPVTGTFVVFNSSNTNNPMGTTQMFITFTDAYFRYRSSTDFSSWKSLQSGSGGSAESIPIGGYDYLTMKDNVKKVLKEWNPLSDLVSTKTGETFNKGRTIQGIPYGSRVPYGRDIFYHINLNSFYSMIENPVSDIYQSGQYEYYGVICSSLSGYLAGQDIYWATKELFNALTMYEFNGGNIRIGDNLLTEGHSRIVTDIITDGSGVITHIGIAEATGSYVTHTMTPIQDFKNLLVQNGGNYIIGRFDNYKPREIEEINYPTDCILNKGHKSIYKTGEIVKLWVNGPPTTIYIKKGDGQYQTVSLSTLPKETVGDNTNYNLSGIINTNGVWYVTTNLNNKPNELLVCDPGNVTITGNSFTVSGYSEHIKPLSYQLLVLEKDGPNLPHPAPVGYSAGLDYDNKHLLNGDTATFNVYEPKDGYYVRVMFKTPYGQTWVDSDYILNGESV